MIATGYKADRLLHDKIKDRAKEVYIIGDCAQIGRIMDAVADAYRVARLI